MTLLLPSRISLRQFARCAARVVLLLAFVVCWQVNCRAQNTEEAALLQTLRSAAPAEKALACKKLAIYGTNAAAPELQKLLSDPQLSSWARIALEAIPGPEAGAALRNALPGLQGKLAVGVVNSLGIRREVEAIDLLTKRIEEDADANVGAAALVALGRIGQSECIGPLTSALNHAQPTIRNGAAEGCILCAEALLAANGPDAKQAAHDLYHLVSKANVVKQRKLEAKRGGILASGDVAALMEELRSGDEEYFQMALMTARELQGPTVSASLAQELIHIQPDRFNRVLFALADRQDAVITDELLKMADHVDSAARVAIVRMLPSGLGGTPNSQKESLARLLHFASDADPAVAAEAKKTFANIKFWGFLGAVRGMLQAEKDSNNLVTLLEVIAARGGGPLAQDVQPLVDHSDAKVRRAAIAALGETIGDDDLNFLIEKTIAPAPEDEHEIAIKSLKSACMRMRDRDACVELLHAAMPRTDLPTQVVLIDILGSVGGVKALEVLASYGTGDVEPLQDAATRILGDWLDSGAAPVLLKIAESAAPEKYRVRALRGYLRIARQFAIPADRTLMCAAALQAAVRDDERRLALDLLALFPTAEGMDLALAATKQESIRQDAVWAAQRIARKIGRQAQLTKAGIDPLSLEIVKAEYGAEGALLEVTQRLANYSDELLNSMDSPTAVALPGSGYNEFFGGDPAGGKVKELRIRYRVAGKEFEAVFPENAQLRLPKMK